MSNIEVQHMREPHGIGSRGLLKGNNGVQSKGKAPAGGGTGVKPPSCRNIWHFWVQNYCLNLINIIHFILPFSFFFALSFFLLHFFFFSLSWFWPLDLGQGPGPYGLVVLKSCAELPYTWQLGLSVLFKSIKEYDSLEAEQLWAESICTMHEISDYVSVQPRCGK